MKGRAPDVVHGKEFEREVNDAFGKLHLNHACTWEKPGDTYTAGNMVTAVEGDFRSTINAEEFGRPWAFAIESKASVIHDIFAEGFRSLVKGTQVGRMNLYMRAGHMGVYMYKNGRT